MILEASFWCIWYRHHLWQSSIDNHNMFSSHRIHKT